MKKSKTLFDPSSWVIVIFGKDKEENGGCIARHRTGAYVILENRNLNGDIEITQRRAPDEKEWRVIKQQLELI